MSQPPWMKDWKSTPTAVPWAVNPVPEVQGGDAELSSAPVSAPETASQEAEILLESSPDTPDAERPTAEAPESDLVPSGPCLLCEETRQLAEAQRQELIEELQRPYHEAATRLDQGLSEVSQRMGSDVARLAMRMAEVLTRRMVEVHPEILTENVSRALRMAGAVETLTLKCHPADAEELRRMVPGLAAERTGRQVDVVVQTSEDVGRGGCILLFDEGIVDARLDNQIRHLTASAEQVIREHFAPDTSERSAAAVPTHDEDGEA